MNLPNLWIFLGALLASGLSVYLVQRYWAHEKRREHTEVAGFIFAGVAVLYAVLLAFVVILGWETLNGAHATTYTEADQLSEDVPAFVELESGGPPPDACRVVGHGWTD
jgi:Ni/Fe-hydrogenase subunit HybB-like protein